MKSFRRKDGADEPPAGIGRNAERSFRGEKRGNETHAFTTDPDARLYRKAQGQPSRLCFTGHLLIENLYGRSVVHEQAGQLVELGEGGLSVFAELIDKWLLGVLEHAPERHAALSPRPSRTTS